MKPEDFADLHARAMRVPGPWSADDFDELLSGAGVFSVVPSQLLRAEEGVGGFALGRVVLDEAELLTLAVDPDFRRQGIGSACLDAFEAEAVRRGATVLHLEVAETNAPAIALYLSRGWERSGRRKAYYASPGGRTDAILMTKRLPGS